jgi:hypothetical protein
MEVRSVVGHSGDWDDHSVVYELSSEMSRVRVLARLTPGSVALVPNIFPWYSLRELEPQFQFVISYEESIVIRKTIVLLIAGLLSLTVSLFAQRESDRNNRPASRVSLIQVIANPKDFDSQRLRLVGYLSQNGLDRAVGVFVSEVDGRNFVLPNSVDLRLEDSLARTLAGKYVAFSGRYHAPAPRTGYNGYIDQILDIKPWNIGDASK